MALTFDISEGVRIAGTSEEISSFAEALVEAADGKGQIVGHLLTEDGVENITVDVVEPE